MCTVWYSVALVSVHGGISGEEFDDDITLLHYSVYFPHMSIGMLDIYRLLFLCFFVCLQDIS